MKGFWYEVFCLNCYRSVLDKVRIVYWKCGIGVRIYVVILWVKFFYVGFCLVLNKVNIILLFFYI